MSSLAISEITTAEWDFSEDVAAYAALGGVDGIGVWRDKLKSVGVAAAAMLDENDLEAASLTYAGGFVPSILDGAALTLAASIVGSTAIWSNFFLESNLVSRKGWTDASDVPTMRTGLVLGYGLAMVLIIAIVVVSATVLRPTGIEEVTSFVGPGLALARPIGRWVTVFFLLGTAAAAFNSIVPIMWVPAYLFEHARGNETDTDDRTFKIISLPITALLLFWAVNDEETMGEHTNGRLANAINSVLVVLAFALAATSLPGVFDAFLG